MRKTRLSLSFVGAFALALTHVSCAGPAAPGAPSTARTSTSATTSNTPLELPEIVESFPVETALDHRDLRDASDVWVEMVDGAKTTLDLAEFYMSDDPTPGAPPSALSKVVDAVIRAAGRGVRVRVLVESAFRGKYPELPERLGRVPGIEVTSVDGKTLYGGGILHAKYFVVDGREAYLGSQNFDYRSLRHIHELGVRTRDPGVVSALTSIFQSDARASGSRSPAPSTPPNAAHPSAGASRISFAASPRAPLPEGVAWDLPLFVERIDSAKREVLVQTMAYKAAFRDGSPFPTLDDALRRALARKVRVVVQVGSWHAKEPSLLALRAAGADVRVIEVPAWSGGEVPFGRVIHAKYMVVDGERAWLGTSNWEGDYFHKSRNVGVFVDDARFAERLAQVFADVSRVLPPKP